MINLKFVASFLIIAGVLRAAYGGFDYTKETHESSIGPFQRQVVEKAHIDISLCIVLGAVGFCQLLLLIS